MVLASSAVACGSDGESDARPVVVASFYPLAYVAQRIGGPDVRVENLVPPGVEPHDLELSPDQVDDIESADVVLVLGRDFQPAVERVARRNQGSVRLLDELDVDGDDPHVWLDPKLMAQIAGAIGGRLLGALPDRGKELTQRLAAFSAEVSALDGRYSAGLSTCARRHVVTAHDAFGRLAARYGLVSRPIAGLSPDIEPDPARLADLADRIRGEGVTTVFTEELVSPRVANALAREAGVTTDVLNPLEGLTDKDVEGGATYFSVMDANLAKLRTALGCT